MNLRNPRHHMGFVRFDERGLIVPVQITREGVAAEPIGAADGVEREAVGRVQDPPRSW